MKNLMESPAEGIASKQWTTGLNKYTQKNCHVTLTDNGYRIYRPPNLTKANNGSTMYGGLRIQNSSTTNIHIYDPNIDNIFGLQQNHTYIIRFHISGQSSHIFDWFMWGNNMGNNGNSTRGLMPAPTNVSFCQLSTNFQGEIECYYKFTITDTITQECKQSYNSSYVAGQTYLAYRDFQVGFSYSNTGELGTDLYITNLRMYDITDNENNYSITEEGIILPAQVIEMPIAQASIQNSGDLICNNFYEY